MGRLYTKHYKLAFWITLIVSLGLLIGSFFCPPMGAVDGSVLAAVGELFLWPCLAFGAKALSEGKTARIRRGDMDVTIGDMDNNEEYNEIDG